ERSQFVVNFHPQRLENLRRRMATTVAADDFLNRACQWQRLPKLGNLALLHKSAGDATRRRLFAQVPKEAGQFFLAVTVDDLAGRFSGGRVHPHVEGPISHQTETALGVFELARRNTEI